MKFRADAVGEDRRAGGMIECRLAVTADVDHHVIHAIGGKGQMRTRLTTRMQADASVVDLDRGGQVELLPGGAAVAGAE